jgi:DNA-binding HxlR family transcriptional regulator
VTYRLTEMGKEIKPILEAVHNWANKWYGDQVAKKK